MSNLIRAAELLLLGEPFSAATAHQYGIVTKVVADGETVATATQAAKKLAARPPAAVRLTKMLMKRATAEAVAMRIREESEHCDRQLRSPEAAEALAAFDEKRAPDFSKFS